MKIDNRTRLLNLAQGHEDMALFCRIGYLLCAMPVEDITGKMDMYRHNEDCTIMPTTPNAVQDVCAAAQGTDEAPHMLAAYPCATEDEIKEAMATRPCLVNFGGTMHAMNTERHGSAAIIMQDMRTISI